MAQHTPGPWNRSYSYPRTSVVSPDGRLVAVVYDPATEQREGETAVANALLVAAAPELLEALRLLYEANDGLRGESAWMDERLDLARAAIAKAEGQG